MVIFDADETFGRESKPYLEGLGRLFQEAHRCKRFKVLDALVLH